MSDVATEAAAIAAESPAAQLSGFRWGPLALCGACLFVEGFDAQFMGYVVPAIAKDWGLAAGALGPALGAGLFGLMLGGFFIAPLADSAGRKRVVLGSLAVCAVLTIATVAAQSLPVLTGLRFLTGLGLGGAMANTIALTAEFSPPGKRASAVTINFASFSIGAAIGGLIAAQLMPDCGWRSVFLFCGGIGIALVVPILLWLPETLRPTAARLAIIPLRELFRYGRSRGTLLFWFLFFINLMELFFLTSWLPTTISSQGISIRWAVIATALVQLGGVAGGLALGPLVDRFGPRLVLAPAFVTAAICVALIGLAGSSLIPTLVAAALCGIGTVGAQNCNNGVAAKFYPTAIRATGVGWALAVGRAGSIVGPVVGGVLLKAGMDVRILFLIAAVPPLCAAAAYLGIGRDKDFDSACGEFSLG